jgi:hypothetical protein
MIPVEECKLRLDESIEAWLFLSLNGILPTPAPHLAPFVFEIFFRDTTFGEGKRASGVTGRRFERIIPLYRKWPVVPGDRKERRIAFNPKGTYIPLVGAGEFGHSDIRTTMRYSDWYKEGSGKP